MLFNSIHTSATLIIAIVTTSVLCTPALPVAQQFLDPQNAIALKAEKGGKVHGENPASYCSDPSTDIYKISNLAFYPINPTIGYYLTIKFFGSFSESTGDTPWLNVTGTVGGKPQVLQLFDNPLCDIDVFQEIEVEGHKGAYSHRSCPPGIREGYAVISSPPIPLSPGYGFTHGKYEIRAEATTQDGRSIFCVEGSFVM